MRADMALSDALDWCCLHLPEASLPAAFKLSRVGEGASDGADAGGAGSKDGTGDQDAKAAAKAERAAAKDNMTSKGRARVPGARMQTKPPSPCVNTVLWIAAPEAPLPASSVPTISATTVGSAMVDWTTAVTSTRRDTPRSTI